MGFAQLILELADPGLEVAHLAGDGFQVQAHLIGVVAPLRSVVKFTRVISADDWRVVEMNSAVVHSFQPTAWHWSENGLNEACVRGTGATPPSARRSRSAWVRVVTREDGETRLLAARAAPTLPSTAGTKKYLAPARCTATAFSSTPPTSTHVTVDAHRARGGDVLIVR